MLAGGPALSMQRPTRWQLATGRISGTYGQDDLLPGGGKIRGCNLIPGANDRVAADQTGGLWAVLWDLWDTAWIEEQLDNAVVADCNVVRIMGSLVGIHYGRYGRVEYLAKWTELNTECVARGLRLYPCMQPGNIGDDITIPTNAFLRQEAAHWTALIHSFTNCIGIDVVQENHSYASSSDGKALMDTCRLYTDLPLTCSIIGGTPSQLGHADNTAAMAAVRAQVDFMDLHWYYTPAATTIETNYWDAGHTKPLVIGEFGSAASNGSTAQETHFDAVGDAINNAGDSGRRPAGAFVWDIQDCAGLATSDQWGLFDSSGAERTNLTALFNAIPIT